MNQKQYFFLISSKILPKILINSTVYNHNLEYVSPNEHFLNVLFIKTDKSRKTFPKNLLPKGHFPKTNCIKDISRKPIAERTFPENQSPKGHFLNRFFKIFFQVFTIFCSFFSLHFFSFFMIYFHFFMIYFLHFFMIFFHVLGKVWLFFFCFFF